jgi:hypothetical protein
MDAVKIKSLLLSTMNDAISITDYGHGHLVTLPLAYYDDDLVTLFVEPYERGVRVSDQGTTAMRLHMTGVDLDNKKITEAWHRSLTPLGPQSAAAEDGVVAAWGETEHVGDLLTAVAEGAMRVDQLRWAANDRRPMKFRERVVHRLAEVAGGAEYVTPNARIRQTSGRTRRVTAAVGTDPATSVYIQAISTSSGGQALEHCYYIFSQSDLARERKLAVASGTPASWPHLVKELQKVTDVAFFDSDDDVKHKLTQRIAAAR